MKPIYLATLMTLLCGCSDSAPATLDGATDGGTEAAAKDAAPPDVPGDGPAADVGDGALPDLPASDGPTPNKVCTDLIAAYGKAFTEARGCNPSIDSLQCTLKVADHLACPCDAFVNPSHAAALATMQKLRAQYAATTCQAQINCPGAACAQPTGGTCQPTATGGPSDGICHSVSN